ncbi:hypothetical protein POTOM_043019 [Populus tomentosa]|uniref:Stalled ribosome sensor GCN1-like HEAT repeats region domain-containing protein n=1 Tax=Populus tomentosa TaxID=118781 RepID=A0A8X8CG16_POPTO|nr:hypothetical protein POTOM_043019 [Populus tomentosa]
MSKHLIKTHHKANAKTHRWRTLLNDLNLRTHPTPKPLTRPLKPSPPLLLIIFFFKPNPFLVDVAIISALCFLVWVSFAGAGIGAASYRVKLIFSFIPLRFIDALELLPMKGAPNWQVVQDVCRLYKVFCVGKGLVITSSQLRLVGSVINNPEISSLVPTLLMGLTDPNEHTKYSLDNLLQTTFINSIDAPSLALLDMIPYIGLLLPEVKKVFEVRFVAERAIGSLIRGVGEENFPDLVPWLLDSLKTDNSNVLSALGTGYFEHVLPDIIRNCSHQKAYVRDGYLTLFKYLPRSLGVQFQNYLQQVLPAILDGLADENESVRDAALGAGHVLVERYAATYAFISLPLLLPAIEDGIFNDNWRIWQSSVELLGDLLFKVAETSRKALLEGGSDDEGSSTEAHGRAIIEVLVDKRNEILATLYIVRTDAAVHVWKAIVANTPKTLKEIMPVLMNTLISSLASSDGKYCEESLLSFMDELIPTIRTALCDSMPEVRESAGLAFSTLYKSAGMQAIDEIVPTLVHALEDDETSDTTLDGLKQILRTIAVLPHILPKLVHLPFSAFNAHALGALAEVAVAGLNFHLGTILPALLSTMGAEDMDVQTLAKEVAETVVLVIDEEGIEYLIVELLKGASIRRSSSYLIGFFFKYSKLYLVDEAPNMISTLIILLSDSDSSTVEVAWEALSRVIGFVPKEHWVLGLGELIEVTSEKALKDFVIPITRIVRTSAAFALGKLSALSTRVDPLVSDLLSSLQASDAGVREAILTVLKGVHPSLTLLGLLSRTVPRALKISHNSLVFFHINKKLELGYSSGATCWLISGLKIVFLNKPMYMEEPQLDDQLELLSNLASSPSWVSNHGLILTISSLLRHNPSSVVTSQMFPSTIHCLKDALKDEKFPLRETSTKALGRLILHQIQSDPSEATAYVDIISTIVSALHDDSNGVRRRGLFAQKAVAKASPPSITVHVSIISLALAKCLKDNSTPIRLAAERCVVHAFQMTKGISFIY